MECVWLRARVYECICSTGVRAAVDWLFIRVQNSRRRSVPFAILAYRALMSVSGKSRVPVNDSHELRDFV
jgi:hypothetical protein